VTTSRGLDRQREVGDPVFLVGSERSGSTLLSHMLDHHPQIAWALALEFAVALVAAPGRWPYLQTFYDYLDASRIFQTSGLRIDRRLPYVELVQDFLAQEGARKGKTVVGATVHRHFDRLPWLFSTCRFIHLVRDPRDVSRSAIGLGFVGNVGATWWAAAEALWDAVQTRVPPERRHEVRYESLIHQPEETLRGICGFVGVSYSPAMLGYVEATNYGPVDATPVEQWRRQATPHDIRIIEAVVGPLLSARGYQHSGLPPLRIGRGRRWWLREHDRYRRVRFRVGRDGVYLTAADFVARHLGLLRYARRVQQRINQIEIQSLR
jgi:hypothetical protein